LNVEVIVTSVVGARPQFVKLAPVHAALTSRGHIHRIVHTGQHYDADMSDVFFKEFDIPPPEVNLGVGSSSHAAQIAGMLEGIDGYLDGLSSDWVLVYGDTNSTLAAAIAATRLGRRTAHLDAGLRSFNRDMPEEQNRVVADHLSDLLLAPTDNAMAQLTREGLADRSVCVGDVMADVCFRVRDAVLSESPPRSAEPFLVATIHRQENTDDPDRLAKLLALLGTSSHMVRLLAHPRLRARLGAPGSPKVPPNVELRSPLGYRDVVAEVLASDGVLTDSGGLQKEAFLLERPCVTLRSETEWPETTEGGWNVILGDSTRLPDGFPRADLPRSPRRPFGDGNAATRVVEELERGLDG